MFFFGLMSIPRPASAYLDPGTGSIIWQMVIAVGFGLSFTLKMYWARIKKLLKREKNDSNEK